ncbi:YhdP family protein [Granulosicoccaceae sp. 1_MG-2023]|nr:YhdP family protein [Granulosicoccaceae sp. 1_MG-2023]
MKRVVHHTTRWTVLLFVLSVLGLALLTGAARISLPFVGAYRDQIQSFVSDYLGRPVEIGSLDMSWRGFGPRLQLDDVVLDGGGDHSQDVHLRQILLGVDLLRSLMNRAWQIGEIALVGADLQVDYLGDNQYRVYGYRIDANKPRNDNGLDVLGWLMNADNVALLDSELQFRHLAENRSLSMKELNVRARNTDGLHRLRVDVLIPELSQARFTLGADFTGERHALKDSAGKFRFAATAVELARLSALSGRTMPLALAGSAQTTLYGNWGEGRVGDLRAISRVQDLTLTSADEARSWRIPALSSDIRATDNGQRVLLDVGHVSVEDGQGGTHVLGAMRAVSKDSGWVADVAGPLIRPQRLEDLWTLLQSLPQTQAVAGALAARRPQGEIRDWRVQLISPAGGTATLSAQAQLRDLTVQAYGKSPGVENLNAELRMRDSEGTVRLADGPLVLNWPNLFEAPLALQQVEGEVGFFAAERAFGIHADDIALSTADFDGVISFDVARAGDSPAQMKISAQFGQVDAVRVRPYLPARKMSPKLMAWLDSAIQGGQLQDGYLEIDGPVKGFPYYDHEARFEAGFTLSDGQIAFEPQWPVLENVQGTLQFRNAGLAFTDGSATTAGNQLQEVSVSLPNYRKPALQIKGQSQTTLEQASEFIAASPLQSLLEPVIGGSTLSGTAGLNVELKVPLKKDQGDKLAIEGVVSFADSRWQSTRMGFDLRKLNGDLGFTTDSLTTHNIRAEFLGAPLRVNAGPEPGNKDSFTQINITSPLPASQLIKHYKLPFDHWFEGESDWLLTLNVNRKGDAGMGVDMQALSYLRGTAVHLPEPYAKPPAEAAFVKVQGEFSPQGMLWTTNYDGKIYSRTRTSAAGGLHSLEVSFGHLPGTEMPPAGIYLEGQLPSLALIPWISEGVTLIDKLGQGQDQAKGDREKLKPVTTRLSTAHLLLGQVDAGAADITTRTTDEDISVDFASRWLNGVLHQPRVYWDDINPVRADVRLLDWQFLQALGSDSDAEGDAPAKRLDPRSFPPLQLRVGRYVHDDFRLTNLQLNTYPALNGLRSDVLGFANAGLTVTGLADWSVSEDGLQHHTDISLSYQVDDLGVGMEAMGFGGAFAEGRGTGELSLSWHDALYAPPLETMSGESVFNLEEGRFLAVEPGAAKMLGVFALHAVPRRLMLDFRDLTDEGLRYDSIDGKLHIGDGKIRMDYLQMQGPIGVVNNSGTTDFINKTYDQQIVVLPRLTSTLPIIGLISGGAVAGVGVLLIDQALKSMGVNFDEVGRREYSLTGTWDDPVVSRKASRIMRLPEPDNR